MQPMQHPATQARMDPMAEKGRKTKGRIVRDGEYGGDGGEERRGSRTISVGCCVLLDDVEDWRYKVEGGESV